MASSLRHLTSRILGIDAATSFIQGYWIWSKIIENLAVVGYDTNNLFLAAYDWRLSFWNLEERDGFYSRLKSSIEEMRCDSTLAAGMGCAEHCTFRKREDRKVVLVAHSMGSSVGRTNVYSVYCRSE